MVDRFRDTIEDVERTIKDSLSGHGANGPIESRRARSSCSSGSPTSTARSAARRCGPHAFESALRHGTVMTDLILGLDPVDTPITDYERFGIRSGAADLIVHPDPDTLRDLSWRPGWRVCLATPSWPDGSPCEFAPREVFRSVVEDVASLGYEVMSAIEYEIRLWDPEGNPMSSGISYSLVEIGRYDRFIDELVRALGGLGVELSAVHTEAGPGAARAQHRSPPGARRRRRRRVPEVRGRSRWPRRWVCARASSPRPCPERRDRAGTSTCRAGRARRTRSPARTRPTRCRPCSAAAVAGVLEHLPAASLLHEPDGELVQAPRSRLVRADQRHVGLREPLLRRARDPLGPARSLAVRVPEARCRREPVPRSRRHRRLCRRRHPARGDATGAHRG